MKHLAFIFLDEKKNTIHEVYIKAYEITSSRICLCGLRYNRLPD